VLEQRRAAIAFRMAVGIPDSRGGAPSPGRVEVTSRQPSDLIGNTAQGDAGEKKGGCLSAAAADWVDLAGTKF
jgi:hypothetical protein